MLFIDASVLPMSAFALYLVFFFFQAEDGIRDDLVTGVQTCALPIYRHTAYVDAEREFTTQLKAHVQAKGVTVLSSRTLRRQRSEERRVGKECRSRWSRWQKKKKESSTRRRIGDKMK